MVLNVGPVRLTWQWLPMIIVLVIFTMLLRLGVWQLQRAVDKADREQRLSDMQLAKRIDLTELAAMAEKLNNEQLSDLPIVVNGRFDPQRIWLIENRFRNSQVGVEVLAMLSSNGLHYLVNLGWLPVDQKRQLYHAIELPTTSVEFNAMSYVPDRNPFMSDLIIGQDHPKLIQQIIVDRLIKDAKVSFQPVVLLVEDDQPMGYAKQWQLMVMPAEKHFGYAVQWFALAVVLLLLALWRSTKWRK